MSDKTEPAMSAEAWAWWRTERELPPERRHMTESFDLQAANAPLAEIIAKANDILPDSDHRKITREKLHALCECALATENEFSSDESASLAFLDALESYLPPASTDVTPFLPPALRRKLDEQL